MNKYLNIFNIDEFKEIIEVVKRFGAWIIPFVYAIGFYLWNSYLSRFGFFEYNIIQLRYVSAGILFFVLVGSVGMILYLIYKRCGRENPFIIGAVNIIIMIIWVWAFVVIIFPEIPQYFGGAKPIRTAIIGTPDQISYLNKFNIPSADETFKPSVQTAPVCLIYQNDNYAVFFVASNIVEYKQSIFSTKWSFSSRAISLKSSNFLGLQAISGEYAEAQCSLSVAQR